MPCRAMLPRERTGATTAPACPAVGRHAPTAARTPSRTQAQARLTQPRPLRRPRPSATAPRADWLPPGWRRARRLSRGAGAGACRAARRERAARSARVGGCGYGGSPMDELLIVSGAPSSAFHWLSSSRDPRFVSGRDDSRPEGGPPWPTGGRKRRPS
eukprot:scaffold3045_cov225-Prasinococcus_capsulatus_cf.AAC.1